MTQQIRLWIPIFAGILSCASGYSRERIVFHRDFSPAEAYVPPQEQPFRQSLCLNGQWDFQPMPLPEGWTPGTGEAPELPAPRPDGWEPVKIKIPSPWNVNNWGGGQHTGAGTDLPYAPSSVYFPSYPESWIHPRMGWLKRTFTVPEAWTGKRLLIHFEAVAGECVVEIDGREVCRHFDQHLPFDADITDFVVPGRPAELRVGIRHGKLFEKHHPQYPMMRATYAPGSYTSDLIGIWQDVFLVAVPTVQIDDVFVQPWVDRNELKIEATVTNRTEKKQAVSLDGEISEWINRAGTDVLSAPEIRWTTGETALRVPSLKTTLEPGESKTVTLHVAPDDRLKLWSPDTPDLYCLFLNLNGKRQRVDRKMTRFGWRQFTIDGTDFKLNGKKIQCFGDIQHPFGPYICSRRFAWAWLSMIKDFGGNAVRPHAQPWPKMYYDLADEMGLLVLDETGLFGSSIELNFEDPTAWENYGKHVERLVWRDRNHPSVVGWSAGNEIFAIALLNKASEEVAKKWEGRMADLADKIPPLDPTRPFVTVDGDKDLNGRMPVWSKHFAHGMQLELLPSEPDKPLIVGESGATYYGRPEQLYPFVGRKAYDSYYGRNEALAVDVYQNVVRMAKPLLAYYSPSEVCWFGLEHLNLGYHDYGRLPDKDDGIFAGKPYEEGKPGYQFERIPPYVCTFNPGLDPALPLYKPLPMFLALQAALAGQSCVWDHYTEHPLPKPQELPAAVHSEALFVGDTAGPLAVRLGNWGVRLSDDPDCSAVIIDGERLTEEQIETVSRLFADARKTTRQIFILSAEHPIDTRLQPLLPAEVTFTDRTTNALANNEETAWGKYFTLTEGQLPASEKHAPVLKQGMGGAAAREGEVILQAAPVDWSLFNDIPENRKCAQIVLYEKLRKPEGAAVINLPLGTSTVTLSTLNYLTDAEGAVKLCQKVLKAGGVDIQEKQASETVRQHNLLLDGPVKE